MDDTSHFSLGCNQNQNRNPQIQEEFRVKILFCPQCELSRELGGSKVAVELAEAMSEIGWETDVKSVPELREHYDLPGDVSGTQALKCYLQECAEHYDVVDYDHRYLPYSRHLFPAKPLFVARSVLLYHLIKETTFPEPQTFIFQLKARIHRKRDIQELETAFRDSDRTVKEADLVNVSNHRDVEALMRYGVDRQKIIVLPYGIDAERRVTFDALGSAPPANPKVAFVGMFDLRKGCVDFPNIVAAILRGVPNTTFKLLGTAGLYQTEREARRFFPSYLQDRLEFRTRYSSNELPALLSDCSAGIFPSYLEGFGFGLIEMLAAGLPVIAYDAPGPSSILPPEKLVAPGDISSLANKIVEILENRELLKSERLAAKAHSQQFNWRHIALKTDAVYRQRLEERSAPWVDHATV